MDYTFEVEITGITKEQAIGILKKHQKIRAIFVESIGRRIMEAQFDASFDCEDIHRYICQVAWEINPLARVKTMAYTVRTVVDFWDTYVDFGREAGQKQLCQDDACSTLGGLI